MENEEEEETKMKKWKNNEVKGWEYCRKERKKERKL